MTYPEQQTYRRRFSAQVEIEESSGEMFHLDEVLSMQAEFNLQSQLQQRKKGLLKFGFLLSGYSREELSKLLDLGGRLFIAKTNSQKIVGYFLVTPGASFPQRHLRFFTPNYRGNQNLESLIFVRHFTGAVGE